MNEDVFEARHGFANVDATPRAQGTKRLIQQLEEQRGTELDARSRATTGKSASPSAERNPVFQQLRLSLADAEATRRALELERSSVVEKDSLIADLRARLIKESAQK